MATKDEIISQLTDAGIDHDPAAPKAELAALLPTTDAVAPVAAPVDPRQAAWDAFLESARKVNPVRFDAQKANGEFSKIPDSFTS